MKKHDEPDQNQVPQAGRLVQIMSRLRGPDGCPWDRQQTPSSLRSYLLEEAYEVAEAIDSIQDTSDDTWLALREELGDLLLQVVFLSQLAAERELFDFDEVARGICDKLVRRHPHVFADKTAGSAEQAFNEWDEIKRKEKTAADPSSQTSPSEHSRLDGVPRSLPGLLRAQRLGERAARGGFDWPAAHSVIGKILEEVEEIRQVLDDDRSRVEEEIGDLLLACTSLARLAGLDAEAALHKASDKFDDRFRTLEQFAAEQGRDTTELELAELERLWTRAKSAG